MSRKAYHNPAPSNLPDGAPKDIVKIEFAKRLQRAMIGKGWNQSELARRAEDKLKQADPEARFGRDNVSTYMRGKSLPGPTQLNALCIALGVKPDDLLPSRGVPSAVDKAPPFDMRQLPNGNVWLRVNKEVSFDTAIKVLSLFRQERTEA